MNAQEMSKTLHACNSLIIQYTKLARRCDFKSDHIIETNQRIFI